MIFCRFIGCKILFHLAMLAILLTRPEVGGFTGAFERLSAMDGKFVNPVGGDSFRLLITSR